MINPSAPNQNHRRNFFIDGSVVAIRKLLLIVISFLLLHSVQATVVFYDGFDYGAGTLGGTSTASVTNWENAKSNITISNSSLTYPGLQISAGQKINMNGGLTGFDGARTVIGAWSSSLSSGAMYFSFLLTLNSTNAVTGGDGIQLVNISQEGQASKQLISINLLYTNSGVNLGVAKYNSSQTLQSKVFFSSGNGANLTADGTTTYLIVGKYAWVTPGTADDAVTVWVNPTNLGASEDPGNKVTTNAGTDGTSSAGRFYIVRGAYANIDELRIGTNWAEVTPTDSTPPPTNAPAISLDPHDASAYVGQSAFFSIVADGTAPLSYQWYFNTNTPVSGGTNSALTLSNVQTNDSGAYFCIVTNSYGSDTSLVANLTVTIPVAPTISSQPQNQTVYPGAAANFTVAASGSEPLSYQWFFNTNTALVGANNSSLTINNVQATNAGTYRVVVNNLAGSATSSVAILAINNNPIAPSFVSQPASVIVSLGGNASFSASASGTAPIFYQWLKNGATIPGATSTTLTFTNVQNSDAASYALRASNSVGTAVSSAVTLTISTGVVIPNSAYNLQGFAYLTTGGGVITETNSAYRKVTNALSFANALIGAYKTPGSVKVIEIMNDLDLGWNEIGTTVQTLASTPFRAHNPPQLHPRLLTTGVSLIDMQPKSGLTIFSANGATIRHCCFNIKNTANVIVRNLKFDEMWEWDEASKGNYDKNDWDFIDLGNGGTVTNIWIDHCTFTKTYDGIVDIKQGSSGITISWCKYTGDDGATNLNSFVWQQLNSLESNKTSYAFYNFLRNNGFSTTDIATIIQGHDKTHLIGANSLKAENANHTITLHHEWFMNPWDRLPRLRAGNVHNFNIYADDVRGLAAKRLRDTRAAAMSAANQSTLNNTYSFNPFLNGSISTESGAVLVEKSVYNGCITPLRNNQTDPSNPVYTGKILALDTIYQMDSAFFRGNSTDPGGTNTLGPVQAPVIPFSWNLPGGVLPYSYTMDDPAQLPAILAAGTGAGVVSWNKTNWLLTSYAATPPTIQAQPQSATMTEGNPASFIVVASGSAPLSYRWYFNTNTPIAGATNSALTLPGVATTNAGAYSVVITNAAGSITSSVANLTVTSSNAAAPQISAAVFSSGIFGFSVSGAANQTYLVQASTNLVDWATLLTTNPATMPFLWTDTATGNFARRFYRVRQGGP